MYATSAVRAAAVGIAVTATLMTGGVALAAITPTPGTVADPGVTAPQQNGPGGVVLGGANVGPLGVPGLTAGPDGVRLGGIDFGGLGAGTGL
ncbi:hypothetical protein [Rhodococcus gannanensis]|uniref:Uncharacterized protein n=1 Tax=Rhodococcus gannanensis TaxID=1960308 RepID=A0ABW4P863_9NOCA